jgi:Tfp pilus assembly protein PilF
MASEQEPRIVRFPQGACLSRSDLALGLGLFVLAVAVFANSLGHGFVWDDLPVILKNRFLTEPGAWWRCFGRDFGLEITRHPVGYYRPLVFLSFVLNHAAAGLRPFAYHLTNVVLHGLITVLVFRLIGRLAGRRIGALAAALFAVHPVHAESVAFVAGRSDLLCAFFLLLSLLATIRSFEARHGARAIWLGAGLLAYTAALLSKEMAIVLPGVLIAYGLIHGYRMKTLLRLCGPATVLVLVYLGFRFCFFPMAGLRRAGALFESGFVERAARLLFLYAAQQVFPVVPTLGAKILMRRPWVDVAAVALLILLIAAARPRRRAADAVAWLLLFLAPTLWVNWLKGIEPSDRFAYVPSIGVCALAAMVAARYWERAPVSRLAVAVVAVVFTVFSFLFSRMWHNPATFWSASLAYHPQCGYSCYNLGYVYWKAGDHATALSLFRKATQLLDETDAPELWTRANLAEILAEAGEVDLAIENCRRGLKIQPGHTSLRQFLAALLSNQGRHDEAIAQLEMALKFAPNDGEICLDLAREHLATQPPQVDRARQMYRRARELRAPPDQVIEAAIRKNER